MTILVELHVDQDGDEIHEGGVELEAHSGGADVVGCGHEALHSHGSSHGIVDTREERNSMLVSQLLGLKVGFPVLMISVD